MAAIEDIRTFEFSIPLEVYIDPYFNLRKHVDEAVVNYLEKTFGKESTVSASVRSIASMQDMWEPMSKIKVYLVINHE